MGIKLFATNSSYSFNMSYSSFNNLRKNIANLLDEEFGEKYFEIRYCKTSDDYIELDRVLENIINEKHLDENYKETLDFLFMNDYDGNAPYRTCGQIYNLIKDVDFGDKRFQYALYPGDDYENFKKFLKECYSKRRNMRWW